MAFEHTITYSNPSDYGIFRGFAHYAFSRELIISFWSRMNGIDYIARDIMKLLIIYSGGTKRDKSKHRISYKSPYPKMNYFRRAQMPAYRFAIRDTLNAVLCLTNCAETDHHCDANVEHPNVELKYNKEFLLNPLIISRNEKERCLIEGSMNSVRISFKLKQCDDFEVMHTQKTCKFLQNRASEFEIMRRKPIQNYDISFLITTKHIAEFDKYALIYFILDFIDSIDIDMIKRRQWLNRRGLFAGNWWKRQWE